MLPALLFVEPSSNNNQVPRVTSRTLWERVTESKNTCIPRFVGAISTMFNKEVSPHWPAKCFRCDPGIRVRLPRPRIDYDGPPVPAGCRASAPAKSSVAGPFRTAVMGRVVRREWRGWMFPRRRLWVAMHRRFPITFRCARELVPVDAIENRQSLPRKLTLVASFLFLVLACFVRTQC